MSYFMRNVGVESRKTYQQKIDSGFFSKYMIGIGLDIGFRGYLKDTETILPTAIGVDSDYPGYDGKTLPFTDASQDFVYTSHCLEHISDYKQAIREWMRVLKTDGYLIISVPHKFLYEKKEQLPSRHNGDHKRFYTAASLLSEIEESLEPNTFRIRHLQENDAGAVYTDPRTAHGRGDYEIEIVIQKLNPLFAWSKNL